MKIKIFGSALVAGVVSVVNLSPLGTAKALAQQATYRSLQSYNYIQKDEGELFRKDPTFRIVNPMALNAVIFPITGNRENGVANGRMRTSFTLNADGSLTAVTNTRTGVKLAGFTGAASVILVDENRQLIWASGVHSYGVDGCFIGRCNRNDNWSENVPPEIMSRVRGYAILQQHNPKWRVFDRGSQFLRWLNSDEGKATLATVATIIAML